MEYFIADTHFYDRKCIGYDDRPFANVAEMNEAMIRNWNAVVTKQDTVYVVGDFCYGNGADIFSTGERLNGRKILIRGNHDSDVNLKYIFAEIHDYLEVTTEEGKVILCHYPLASFRDMQRGGTIHIYGHVHNTFEAKVARDTHERLAKLGYRFEAYNVGCMQAYMNYTPRSIAQLRELVLKEPLRFDRMRQE
jgi:calcineurin-like phosphoesterase family protein